LPAGVRVNLQRFEQTQFLFLILFLIYFPFWSGALDESGALDVLKL
jgi:hypothetical protein